MDAAKTALLEFAETDLARKYPACLRTWQDAWERFIPFLALPYRPENLIDLGQARPMTRPLLRGPAVLRGPGSGFQSIDECLHVIVWRAR